MVFGNVSARLFRTSALLVCKPHVAAGDYLEPIMIAIETKSGQLLQCPKHAATALSISPRKLWSLTAAVAMPIAAVEGID